jgi:hypothetical protein
MRTSFSIDLFPGLFCVGITRKRVKFLRRLPWSNIPGPGELFDFQKSENGAENMEKQKTAGRCASG